jgi:peptidoglycan biosynthesis protein MviN/MurJ (putative lipid II flippase)
MEQTRPVLVVAGVTLVVKTVSTVVLMHIFGAAGIAAATVIAFATSAGLQAWVTVRLLRQGADHA